MLNITCSPVAPHNKVNAFDGSTVTIGPAGECNSDDFRLSEKRKMLTARLSKNICMEKNLTFGGAREATYTIAK